MRAYAELRLVPKLRARTASRPECNRYEAIGVEFMEACVCLHAWLGNEDIPGIAKIPGARLYPVAGGLTNACVRLLIDWSRLED